MNLEPINQTKLYGFNNTFNQFVDLYKKKKIPTKILLSGQKGIGKCTFAYHLVNYILSFGEEYSYDLKNFSIKLTFIGIFVSVLLVQLSFSFIKNKLKEKFDEQKLHQFKTFFEITLILLIFYFILF